MEFASVSFEMKWAMWTNPLSSAWREERRPVHDWDWACNCDFYRIDRLNDKCALKSALASMRNIIVFFFGLCFYGFYVHLYLFFLLFICLRYLICAHLRLHKITAEWHTGHRPCRVWCVPDIGVGNFYELFAHFNSMDTKEQPSAITPENSPHTFRSIYFGQSVENCLPSFADRWNLLCNFSISGNYISCARETGSNIGIWSSFEWNRVIEIEWNHNQSRAFQWPKGNENQKKEISIRTLRSQTESDSKENCRNERNDVSALPLATTTQ